MTYEEDENLPDWVDNPDSNPDDKAFHEWYCKTFSVEPSRRSARYYQMRRAWIGSKQHYKKG